jgi:hypothetical protein
MELDKRHLIYNKAFYLCMKSKIDFQKKDIDSVYQNISLIEKIGRFAWRNHPGCFYDAEIENLLLQYGNEMENSVDTKKISKEIDDLFPAGIEYSSLYIATEIANVGGHTRGINQMIKRSKEENQCFVLTDSDLTCVPEWFEKGNPDNTKILSLNNYKSYYEKAYALRILSNRFKRVLVFHHPFDSIPVLAFAKKGNVPVIIDNHAHSWFWLGISVADMVLCHSEYRKEFTKYYRDMEKCHNMPFAQFDNIGALPHADEKLPARKRLNIEEDKTVVLTIATREKFIPNYGYNFFNLVEKILNEYAEVIFIIIGIADDDELVSRMKKSDRLFFHQQITDLTDYYLASDICLESMPQPSLGVQIQAPVIGLSCPVPKYGKAKVFKMGFAELSNLYNEHFGKEMTESEFYEKLDLFIKNKDLCLRTAEEIRASYLGTRSDEILYQNIQETFRYVDELAHNPRILKSTVFHEDAESIEISERSELQDFPQLIDFWKEEFTINDLSILGTVANKYSALVEYAAHLDENYKNRQLSAKLYYSDGSGFTEDNSKIVILPRNYNTEVVTLEFDLSSLKGIRFLRFDPIEDKVCIVELLEVEITSGGTKILLHVAGSNSLSQNEGKFLFATNDPQIYFEVPSEMKKADKISIKLNYSINEDYFLLMNEGMFNKPAQPESGGKIQYSAKLYYDNGAGYSEDNAKYSVLPKNTDSDFIKLEYDMHDIKKITSFRFDPLENVFCGIEIQSILAISGDKSIDLLVYNSNAVVISDDKYFFNDIDPQIYIAVPDETGDIEKVVIKLKYSTDENYVNSILDTVIQFANGAETKDSKYVAKLYYDLGGGYSEENTMVSTLPGITPDNAVELEYDLSGLDNIRSLRFDPVEGFPCVVELLSLKVNDEHGLLESKITKANSEHYKNGLFVFSTDDPSIEFNLPKKHKKCTSLQIKYRLLIREK